MKLYHVTYERDGFTVKAPGVSETEIKKESLYYVADSFDAVFEATKDLRDDPERRLFSIGEALPMVTVLTAKPGAEQ
jgi:hypothetical protein